MTAPLTRARGRHVRGPWIPPTFRNALSLVVLSALLPGSAQVTSGRLRALGWVALSVWVALVLTALAALGYVLVTEDVHVFAQVAVSPRKLQAVRLGAAVVGLGWLALLAHAWWISGARRWEPGQRAVATVTTVAIALTGLFPVGVAARYAGIQRTVIGDVFDDTPNKDSFTAKQADARPSGRINVLLLGGDGGKNREGVRTDAMQVASVDQRTGRAVLIALPRSLQKAPFPSDSPLAEKFPDGFDDLDGLLASVYIYGRQHPKQFPQSRDPGAEAIMQVAGEITGLPIHRYVLVNLQGFERLVDAIGGIDILVKERVPIGGRMGLNGAVLTQPKDWIEPDDKPQHLDGYKALWFARGRFGADDYARMRRQRCVVSAILDQANPWTVIRNYQDIAASTRSLVSTNIPQSELSNLVDVALDARKHPIVNVTFTRDVIDTTDPNFPRMRRLVERAIRQSLATRDTTATGSSAAKKPKAGKPKPKGTRTPKPRDVTKDLEQVCGG